MFAEFLVHGKAIREERKRAAEAGEEPNFVPLIQSWGGVSLVYRKRLQDSPAYRLNHEEVQKALEEGINFIELMSPTEAVPDEYGAIKALVLRSKITTRKPENSRTRANLKHFRREQFASRRELRRT